MTKRTGGRILVDQPRIQGCDRIFTVPGESFLAVLDTIHNKRRDTVALRPAAEASGHLHSPDD